jgi:hypothetical protein
VKERVEKLENEMAEKLKELKIDRWDKQTFYAAKKKEASQS